MMSRDVVVEEASSEIQALARRDLSIFQQFQQAMIADDELADEIPNGVLLVLIPDQDPEVAEMSLRSAMDLVRRGKNAYFRHVYRVADEINDLGEPVYSPYPGGKKPTDNER